MTIEILPADHFTVQELTDLYNQTRVDYLVPMPMNADRLNEYIKDFDVDLRQSCVARDADGQVLGLCMLGLRRDIAWITRLGVLPSTRRNGAGSALMDSMLKNADALGMKETHLEVIKNNEPAYRLFLKKGFVETATYLVMRHAPRPLTDSLQGNVTWLNHDKALEKLSTSPCRESARKRVVNGSPRESCCGSNQRARGPARLSTPEERATLRPPSMYCDCSRECNRSTIPMAKESSFCLALCSSNLTMCHP